MIQRHGAWSYNYSRKFEHCLGTHWSVPKQFPINYYGIDLMHCIVFVTSCKFLNIMTWLDVTTQNPMTYFKPFHAANIMPTIDECAM